MSELPTGQVSGGPLLSVADEMAWGRQYEARVNAADLTLTQRVVASEVLPIPAKALGVVIVRLGEAVAQAVSSIREGM